MQPLAAYIAPQNTRGGRAFPANAAAGAAAAAAAAAIHPNAGRYRWVERERNLLSILYLYTESNKDL